MNDPDTTQTHRDALDALLCFDVYAAHQAFGRLYKPFLTPIGLTYPQYLVILLLDAARLMSVGDVGTAIGLASNTLTPLLKRMEQAGLIQRLRDTKDERRVLLRLTDKGVEAQKAAREVPRCMARAGKFDPAKIRDLQEQLRDLTRQLDAAQRP
ncbi:MarR family transcriptional regulator [Aliishimia ponticola]|uniref:MarR family transcriptional regulator n=1 Tax=Aliishimia ponticola TaxID=2499833 RepID=A0A4S4NA66_9RHOB|nr:MarR family transcriptional regulator [Aliishimia ponticola]THH36182.1 MarR family transcriptional regulator [Aliishimia ponticola]